MLKIIELDIDPELSGDTGVWEVAWVEYPAIEQELMYFGRQKFYKAPEYVSQTACQAIKENEKRGNPAATQTGKIRAQQLCKRDEISLETIKRMKSYLERAETYNTDNWDDKGTISWKLWGGKEGLTWVNSILEGIKNKEEMAEVGPRGGIKESEKAPKSDTPNPNPKGEGTAKGDASSTRGAEVSERVEEILKEKSDDFNEKYKDKLGYGVNVGMLKSVYQRGVGAYNTSHSPEVKSSEQWALARVNAFLYLVKEGRPENKKYDSDFDLLPSGHPKKPEDFVYPNPGESKDDFISRCIPYVLNEGLSQDEALGKCYGMWGEKFTGQRIGFDWRVLETPNGIRLFENEMRQGNLPVIFVEGFPRQDLIDFTNKYRIPISSINSYRSSLEKIDLIEKMGLPRHYDDDFYVRGQLGERAMVFDYDTSSLPPYTDYSPSGSSKPDIIAPSPPSELFNECGCGKEEFSLLGYIDGQPVFETPEEAEQYGEKEMGCSGHHVHTNEDGTDVYMACETHPEEMGTQVDLIVDGWDILTVGPQENIQIFSDVDWTDEELEMKEHFDFLRQQHPYDFERVSQPALRGLTEQEVYSINHKNPTSYYLYERQPIVITTDDRDFCMSIEGRYFRISQIYALEGFNTEFGHNRQPYSKWLYKGGPLCVHAWRKFTFQRKNKKDEGLVSGKPGIPPRNMENQGYYSKETKRKSEVAYIISQQNMSKERIELEGELLPLDYVDGYPIYDDPILASDVSYMLGCGGIYDTIDYQGKQVFRSCSTKMKKPDVQSQIFKQVDEKRMVYTPLMIPNILIPRMDEVSGERYYVKFKPEVIEKIRNKFMLEQRLRETNYEHTDKKFSDVVMVESWIVEGPHDKSYQLGFTPEQVPVGTWMGGFKVLETKEGDEVWNDLIKPKKVRGASVEGNFILNFSRFQNDEYLLKEIINILKQVI